MKLYHEIDRLWVNEHAAILPIAYGRSVAAHRPWIHGFWGNPLAKAALDQIVVERSVVATAPEEPEAVQSQ
jgi:hypothetical protein